MGDAMDALAVLKHFYPQETPLYCLLLKHSMQVRDKALAILAHSGRKDLSCEIISTGAMLHDIGIVRCHAPGILCEGDAPYIAHGTIGGAMLREYAKLHQLDLEAYARICERHTGTGLTAAEIREQHLPLPEQDFCPETPEEKLICLADKFFSKSGDMCEKPLPRVRHSLQKFGPDTVERFDAFCRQFGLDQFPTD